MKNTIRKILFAAVAIAAAAAPAAAQITYTPYAITTLAGLAGNYGHVDATGLSARFEFTYGVAADASGNVYVADSYTISPQTTPASAVIRKITPGGVVTTLAGQSGIGGSTDGPGAAATFGNLGGIAIDGLGFLYVTDRTNGSIRKIDSSSGYVTTIVPSGTLNNPIGIAVDGSGNLYVAENWNYVIRKITQAGAVSTLAGMAGSPGYVDATGTSAQFGNPNGVAVDSMGNVYVTDSNYSVIRKITSVGVVSTYAGQAPSNAPVDGSLAVARFYRPFGIAVDASGNLFVTDNGTLVREISASGNVTTLAGSVQLSGSVDGTGGNAKFLNPDAIAVAASGTLYIGDTPNYTVRVGTSSNNNVVPPSIQVQPLSQTVNTGATVTFSVTAGGTAPLIYQWTFDGGTVGTNSSSFSIPNVQSTDAGNYVVTVTNSAGNITSAMAVLTVNPGPDITAQPQSQTVNDGASTTFRVTATGTGLTYQWKYNGVPITGATGSTLTISNTGATAAGSYTVVVTDSLGNSLTSSAAALTVSTNARLINISSRAFVGTGNNILIAGFVAGGSGSKSILIRGIGPTLANFSVTGALATPQLVLVDTTQTQQVIATNIGWGNASTLGSSSVQSTIAPATGAIMSSLGAFALPANSADCAMVATLPAAAYSAEVSGANGSTGIALAELYDADTGTPTARLVNISSRAFVGTDSNILIAGFVIEGTTSETVLIRGIGPALANFNLAGVLAAPQLTLVDTTQTQQVIATNTGWGNASTLGSSSVQSSIAPATAAIMNSFGAFALPANSADCAMVATLPPGGYTVEVSGVGATTGIGLVEVYEVR